MSSKEDFIKNPFNATREQYHNFYAALKKANDKNEAKFIKSLKDRIEREKNER